ncbi:hypothetical protein HZA97_08525 [Candidatus Woesearchaeota archaeon]|nr:hypothetical protein [Candidatus Woesearchaeota archaeon]
MEQKDKTLLSETVKSWEELKKQYGGNILIATHSDPTSLIDSLEEKAKEEYENIKKLFVDPTGDAFKQYSVKEKITHVVFKPLSRSQNVKTKLDDLEFKVVERCVKRYLKEVKQKIDALRTKYQNTEAIYERSLGLITGLKIEYVNRLCFAHLFEEERVKAVELLDKEKKKLDEFLENNQFEDAHETQKNFLTIEKNARQLEQGRDNNSLEALNDYNQLVLIHETYKRTKVFCTLLQKTTNILQQTYSNIVNRWDEYKKAGNMKDIVESSRLTEVLRNAEETFKKHFEEALPLLKQSDQRVLEKIGTLNNLDYENKLYETAQSFKKNVIDLTP